MKVPIDTSGLTGIDYAALVFLFAALAGFAWACRRGMLMMRDEEASAVILGEKRSTVPAAEARAVTPLARGVMIAAFVLVVLLLTAQPILTLVLAQHDVKLTQRPSAVQPGQADTRLDNPNKYNYDPNHRAAESDAPPAAAASAAPPLFPDPTAPPMPPSASPSSGSDNSQ